MSDHRFSAAAERNKVPIAARLVELLPPQGIALEIASGSGQHAVHFAAALPGWSWQPTDADPKALPSIRAWIAAAGVTNVQPPLQLDIEAVPPTGWPLSRVDLVYCANLLHISDWLAGIALFAGAAAALAPEGWLIVYGPFFVDGEPVAPSNRAFDADLRARDPAWGLRQLSAVEAAAGRHRLALVHRFAMPANNLLLAFRPSRKAGP